MDRQTERETEREREQDREGMGQREREDHSESKTDGESGRQKDKQSATEGGDWAVLFGSGWEGIGRDGSKRETIVLDPGLNAFNLEQASQPCKLRGHSPATALAWG